MKKKKKQIKTRKNSLHHMGSGIDDSLMIILAGGAFLVMVFVILVISNMSIGKSKSLSLSPSTQASNSAR